MAVAQCLRRLGPVLSGPEAFEVLMEWRASKVSSSGMWMSLIDELGVGIEGTGGSENKAEVKTKSNYWLKRVAFS